MTFLLDTNMVVVMIRGLKVYVNPNPRQRERHRLARRIFDHAQEQKRSGHQVSISAITVAELEFGAWNSGDYQKEAEATRRALTPFTLMAFDAQDCAVHYGKIRYELESVGKAIGSMDTLIAAHALAVDARLITTDTSEFSRVPGLKCEDWTT